MRVGSFAGIGLSVLLGASLLQTSIPVDADVAAVGPRLNFRLDSRSVEAPRPPSSVDTKVWAIIRPLPSGPADEHTARAAFPDGIDAVQLTLTLGADDPVAVLTNALTVPQLFGALHVRIRAKDLVKPGLDRRLWPGAIVQLVRIREVVRTEVIRTAFKTLIRYSKDLVIGTRRIQEEGELGRSEQTYLIRFRNGREVSRVLLSERVLFRPVGEVVLEGTLAPGGGGSHRQVGQASWYDFCPVWGMYAAHLSIPKGTLVHVRNLDNGKTVDVVINDRGPYGVPGRIIDLCQPAFAAIAPLGQGVADVEITW